MWPPDVTKCSVKLQQPAAACSTAATAVSAAGLKVSPRPRRSPVSPLLAADTLGPTSNKETEVSRHLCSPASGQFELSTSVREILQYSEQGI